ncbi:MAG: dihydrodipicolinate reductase [Acidimicrobiaceae bacterium]|nr:dihydrodipicolinate reductase [Acidimicrobiaceae bacterium]
MVRVGVLGAAGKMGGEVCRAVASAPDLELVAAVDPGARGRSLAEVAGLGGNPLIVAEDPEELVRAGAEVAVDFTRAASARQNLAWCAANGLHVVCGTTGLSADDWQELEALFAPLEAPNALWAPNFAITAVLLVRLAELAAPHLDGVEIVELHHDAKVDAPSGTALETARRIAAARDASGAPPFPPDPTTEVRLAGARGGEGPGGIRVHAVRLRGLVAHEEVLFGGQGQSLTIRQDSYDRTSFMPGVLLAVRKVAVTPGLTLGLESVLGL